MQVLELRHGDRHRPLEYRKVIEELKKSIVKSIDIVKKLHKLGLEHGLTSQEIRQDIERALAGVVKPRQLRSLLPLELKNVNKIRPVNRAKSVVAAAAAANKPLPQHVIEFRGKISKMGSRYVVRQHISMITSEN